MNAKLKFKQGAYVYLQHPKFPGYHKFKIHEIREIDGWGYPQFKEIILQDQQGEHYEATENWINTGISATLYELRKKLNE